MVIAVGTVCFLVTVFLTPQCQGIMKFFHRAQEFEGNIEMKTALSLIESFEGVTQLECVRECYRVPGCYSLILQEAGTCVIHKDYMRIHNMTANPGLSFFYFERGSCEESRSLTFTPAEKFCFKIVQGRFEFADAQDQCEQEGLNLAKPDTEGKVEAVSVHLKNKGYVGLYMHTSLTYSGAAWTWGDGTEATSVLWQPNQPSSDPLSKPCGNLFFWFHTAKFYSLLCSQKGSVLCEKIL